MVLFAVFGCRLSVCREALHWASKALSQPPKQENNSLKQISDYLTKGLYALHLFLLSNWNIFYLLSFFLLFVCLLVWTFLLCMVQCWNWKHATCNAILMILPLHPPICIGDVTKFSSLTIAIIWVILHDLCSLYNYRFLCHLKMHAEQGPSLEPEMFKLSWFGGAFKCSPHSMFLEFWMIYFFLFRAAVVCFRSSIKELC